MRVLESDHPDSRKSVVCCVGFAVSFQVVTVCVITVQSYIVISEYVNCLDYVSTFENVMICQANVFFLAVRCFIHRLTSCRLVIAFQIYKVFIIT